MKSFLVLQLRPNDEAADGELQAIIKFGVLSNDEITRIRMEKEGIPDINLDDFSGVIVGGGSSNVSDKEEEKSPEQQRFEKDLVKLLDKIIEKDFPYLGACYGIGILAIHQKCPVSKEHFTEDVGPTEISLTEEAANDPLTRGLPKHFLAFVGHKEACQEQPANSVLLATSKKCPVQMIRLKNNIYGLQFHPELDVPGIIQRINIYKYAGYFPPEDADRIIEICKQTKITVPPMILKKFIERYRQ
ncbi:MAG: glutamine amidotransferase [Patescibacteria group bacterium]